MDSNLAGCAFDQGHIHDHMSISSHNKSSLCKYPIIDSLYFEHLDSFFETHIPNEDTLEYVTDFPFAEHALMKATTIATDFPFAEHALMKATTIAIDFPFAEHALMKANNLMHFKQSIKMWCIYTLHIFLESFHTWCIPYH